MTPESGLAKLALDVAAILPMTHSRSFFDFDPIQNLSSRDGTGSGEVPILR